MRTAHDVEALERARRARIEKADRDLKSLAEATRKLQESRERGSFSKLADFVARPLPRARRFAR